MYTILPARDYERNAGQMTLLQRYYRFLCHIFRWWAVGFTIIAAGIFACALADLIAHLGFGYPWWVLPILIAAMGLGIAIHRAAGAALRVIGR